MAKRSRKSLAVAQALLSCAIGLAAPASVANTDATSALAPTLQRWVETSAAATWNASLPVDGMLSGLSSDGDAGKTEVRVQVEVGQLSPRLRLASCARIEPFLPAGTRLWGRSFIGIRCVEGASWSAMLPVDVTVYGPGLVARVPMRIGTPVRRERFRLEEVDWTASAQLPVLDPALLEGHALARPLAAGQVLQANHLRIAQTIAAGDPVRVRMIGSGFSISTSGFALSGAGDGQSLRIRTETGKMLVGTVRGRTVEIRL